MITGQQNRLRDVCIQNAWDAQQPWILPEEGHGLNMVRDEVFKMLARAYESGYNNAQKDIKRAIGFPA